MIFGPPPSRGREQTGKKMFTGIITDVGAVRSVERRPGVSRFRIASALRRGGHRHRRLHRLRRLLPDGHPRRGRRRTAPFSTWTSLSNRCRAPRWATGSPDAPSTWSGPRPSARSSAGIWSPAMWTASPGIVGDRPRRRVAASRHPVPARAGPLRCAEGLGRAGRHLVDDQRSARTNGRRAIFRKHHSPHAARHLLGTKAAGWGKTAKRR